MSVELNVGLTTNGFWIKRKVENEGGFSRLEIHWEKPQRKYFATKTIHKEKHNTEEKTEIVRKKGLPIIHHKTCLWHTQAVNRLV